MLGFRNSAGKGTKFFRYGARNYFFCELFAFVVADVGDDEAVLGALEVVVFDVGGEEDVGVVVDGVGDEEGA